MFFSQVRAAARNMQASNNYELTEDNFQLGKWTTGFRGLRAEPIQGKFFPWIICALLIFSLMISAVTLGIVVHLKNSEMTNVSLAKLQSDVLRLIDSMNAVPSINTWRLFKQREYYFSSKLYRWKEAQKFCESMDSNLVVVNNQEEQEYIQMDESHNYWIGLHDSAEEGIWRWVDGTDYASNVKFWGENQPNGHEEFDEDCALISGDGLWHDWPCNSMHFAICEKQAT